MNQLIIEKTDASLFTYKVVYDAGTAPNPYAGVCTLAICKPAIRSTAKGGDIVVGLEPGNSGRVIYCMQVTDKKPWDEYIELCTNSSASARMGHPEYAQVGKKVPGKITDQGDCIWYGSAVRNKVRASHSGHGLEHFVNDIEGNRFVLLSTRFWYFGKGDRFKIYLPEMPLPGRGHRSKSNKSYMDQFINSFNEQLMLKSIEGFGVMGKPDVPPEMAERSKCSRCRVEERDNDSIDEEHEIISSYLAAPSKSIANF